MIDTRRIVVITGATAGLGLAAAKRLAAMGDHIVIHGRNRERAHAAEAAVRAAVPNASLETALGDLASYDGIMALATEITSRHPRLDVLILNAGIYAKRRTETPDGIEETFMVNHLSQYLLMERLAPHLKEGSRVIVVASQAHHSAKLDMNDLEFTNGRYRGWLQYSNTKLMNLLFARALARRLKPQGVAVNAVHPGVVNTGIVRRDWRAKPVFRLFGLPPERAADTIVQLAVGEDGVAHTGQYYADGKRRHPRRAAMSDELADELWEKSAAYAARLHAKHAA